MFVQNKLTKPNYFVKQNALRLIQGHTEENKSEVKP